MTSAADRRARTTELVAALRSRIDDLARALFGEPNRAMSSKRVLRFGSKGALCIWIAGPKRGGWADFSGDTKGTPLGLVCFAKQCGFAAAQTWARAWLCWPDDDGKVPGAPAAQPDPPPANETPIDDTADAERRAEIARRFWHDSEPVRGTVGESYLIELRKIPVPLHGWPGQVRFHRNTRSLILAATTADDTVRAVQMVRLTPSARVVQREDGGKLKITRGTLSGVAVRLPGPADGPLLLAEGPETGLSVWRATYYETWIALGSMSRLSLPPGRQVIVCADDDLRNHPDPRKTAAARALARAVQQWRQSGHVIAIAMPNATRREDKTDFNDLLQLGGIAAVRARFDLARVDLLRRVIERKRQVADQIIPHAIADPLAAGRKSHDILEAAGRANCDAGSWLTISEVHAACIIGRHRQERLNARRYRKRAA